MQKKRKKFIKRVDSYAAEQFYKKENFASNIPNRNENSDEVSYRKKVEKNE
ncbi:TPA: hypothetical protein OYH28_002504 [Staphylococcus aureus]|nr:hypothetical protein [Staphylococcus aureus]HCC5686870.1 hypothetical protein [Staphylococcus aureus]HCX0010540.1 hypothetical protein [Staphylococcus aureus]HEI7544739.1 hypothetical protein [Staphylococcus aureus]